MRTTDLGIEGRIALVCGSSSGLGESCAIALASAGAVVIMNGRDPGRLEAAVARCEEATGILPRSIVADVTTPQGRERLAAEAGDLDILVTNAAGPPVGHLLAFNEAQWLDAVQKNMLSAILLINAVVNGMIERRWGRIINISSAAVKAPVSQLVLSTAARAGLIGYAAALAREIAPHGVTVNNLLPGAFQTDRLLSVVATRAQAEKKSAADVLRAMAALVPARRIGRPQEFGAWCAFFASELAGYVTGQSLLLDGGAYPGLF